MVADPVVMSLFGTPSVQPIQSLNQAERASPRDRAKSQTGAGAKRIRGQDQVELEVGASDADDAVRGLSGGTSEEAAEDRKKQDGYRPQTKPDEGEGRVPLDLSA